MNFLYQKDQMLNPPNSSDAADEIIRDVEFKYGLLDFKVDNWCIWPILRFPIAMRLMNLPWTQITGDEKVTVDERLRIGVSDVRRAHFRQSDYFIFTSSSGRADTIENKYIDIYFDELLPHIGNYFKLEHINNKQYFRRENNILYPSQMTTNAPYIFAGLLAKTGQPRSINSIANSISKIIIEKIKVDNVSASQIAGILRTFYWRKIIYNYLFHKIHPRKLLLINAYNNHALVAAAKENYINVYEFQHGLVSAHHPGYSWISNALPYKRNMPIPDTIFLYGDYWKSELLSGGFWQNELISVGSLRMDRYRNIRLRKKPSNVCKIIITTQGLDITNLSNFLVEFLISIRPKLKIHLYIKLHPREHDQQIYQSIFEGFNNVTIILGSSLPSTFDLLAGSDFHASISSTCHYEALALGLPTLILPFSSHEKVLHLLKTGFAVKIESPAQMQDYILTNFHTIVPASIGNTFFLSNALDNILVNLNR